MHLLQGRWHQNSNDNNSNFAFHLITDEGIVLATIYMLVRSNVAAPSISRERAIVKELGLPWCCISKEAQTLEIIPDMRDTPAPPSLFSF